VLIPSPAQAVRAPSEPEQSRRTCISYAAWNWWNDKDYGSANSEVKTVTVTTFSDCARACGKDACCK
jgi:hypothetical protein